MKNEKEMDIKLNELKGNILKLVEVCENEKILNHIEKIMIAFFKRV